MRWIFRFLKYLEGHALFYMVYVHSSFFFLRIHNLSPSLGVLLLGISGNTGILIGSYVMVMGFILLIVAIIVRIASGSSAGRYAFHPSDCYLVRASHTSLAANTVYCVSEAARSSPAKRTYITVIRNELFTATVPLSLLVQ